VGIARASANVNKKKIEWLHQPPVSGHYEGPMEIDPFTVPLDKKVSLLLEADKVMATNFSTLCRVRRANSVYCHGRHTNASKELSQFFWRFPFEEMDFVHHAEEVADLAVALLTAPNLPQGSLQVHESVGHATELDRVLGYEASYAGTSFATLDNLGKLQYGSPAMNITSDPTLPYGLGSFGWDDEGTPAHQV